MFKMQHNRLRLYRCPVIHATTITPPTKVAYQSKSRLAPRAAFTSRRNRCMDGPNRQRWSAFLHPVVPEEAHAEPDHAHEPWRLLVRGYGASESRSKHSMRYWLVAIVSRSSAWPETSVTASNRSPMTFEHYAMELQNRVMHAVDDGFLDISQPGFGKAEIFFATPGRNVKAQQTGNTQVTFLAQRADGQAQSLCEPDNLEAPDLDRATSAIARFLSGSNSDNA
jgi:hypothetical protein